MKIIKTKMEKINKKIFAFVVAASLSISPTIINANDITSNEMLQNPIKTEVSFSLDKDINQEKINSINQVYQVIATKTKKNPKHYIEEVVRAMDINKNVNEEMKKLANKLKRKSSKTIEAYIKNSNYLYYIQEQEKLMALSFEILNDNFEIEPTNLQLIDDKINIINNIILSKHQKEIRKDKEDSLVIRHMGVSLDYEKIRFEVNNEINKDMDIDENMYESTMKEYIYVKKQDLFSKYNIQEKDQVKMSNLINDILVIKSKMKIKKINPSDVKNIYKDLEKSESDMINSLKITDLSLDDEKIIDKIEEEIKKTKGDKEDMKLEVILNKIKDRSTIVYIVDKSTKTINALKEMKNVMHMAVMNVSNMNKYTIGN